MSGAVSFVLGLLGLGAAGGVSVGQSVSQKKKKPNWRRCTVGTKLMLKSRKCTSVFVKSGGASQTVIQTV